MDVKSIPSFGSLRQIQTLGGAQSRLKTEPASDPEMMRPGSGQTDTVEISADAKAAYQKTKAEESPEYQRLLAEMAQIQSEVIAHEQAHMAAGGSVAGAASYTYTVGPNGKRYISGGEVPISIPVTNDKERMLLYLEQVRKAALAPARPSSQDLSVAAEASAKEANVRGELAAEKIKETNEEAIKE